MLSVAIRPARPADYHVIADFNLALALETENLTLDPATIRRGVQSILSDPSKGRYLVADADNQIVGQVMITYEWSDWRNANIWWLQSVYVRPDLRGQGVFRQLFAFVRAQAQASPEVCGLRLYIHTANNVARNVYSQLGFVPTHYQVLELPNASHAGPETAMR